MRKRGHKAHRQVKKISLDEIGVVTRSGSGMGSIRGTSMLIFCTHDTCKGCKIGGTRHIRVSDVINACHLRVSTLVMLI